MRDNGQPQGIGAGTEFMSGKSSVQGVETCTVVEWMQSLETASRIIHDSHIGDQLEKIAFNALPAQFSRDLKTHSYYTLPNQVKTVIGQHGFNQDYNTGVMLSPYSGFPCCRYNMHMGWPYFIKNSCLATPDGGIAMNTYGPMEISATVANDVSVTINEDTNYPFEEQIRLNIAISKQTTFPLVLRIPEWCSKPEILLNGKRLSGVKSASMFTIKRTWNNNDKVVLNFPMEIALGNQVNNGVSVERGPLVYALKIKKEVKTIKQHSVLGFQDTEIFPASAWNYALSLSKSPLNNQFSVVKAVMPINPFDTEVSPVTLKVKAKQLDSWTLDYAKTAALDVPFSPVSSSNSTEEISLVPFGSENIRLSIFPTLGDSKAALKSYRQTFDNNKSDDWVVYGGGWFYKDDAVHCASNENNSSGRSGSKIVATGTNFKDFDYTADVAVNATGDAGLMFRVSDPAIGSEAYKGYYLGLNPTKGTIELGKASNGKWTVIAVVNYPMKMNENYQVSVKAIGNQFQVFINGSERPLLEAKDGEYKEGHIGLRAYGALATIDNIKVKAL